MNKSEVVKVDELKMPECRKNILAIALHKDSDQAVLADFERLIMFGLQKNLALFSNILLLDYAAEGAFIQLPSSLDSPELRQRVLELGKHHQCRYVLHGMLNSKGIPVEEASAFTLEFKLFDTQKEAHVLDLNYDYTDFIKDVGRGYKPTPTWQGVQDVIFWMTFQVVGAIQPEQASAIWSRVQRNPLAKYLRHYETLVRTHYAQRDKDYGELSAQLRDLTLEDPNLMLAHYSLASLYKRMGRYGHASVAYENAFRLMKDVIPFQRAECANNAGVCCALANNVDKACQWWQIAINEDTSFLTPYLNLAHALEDKDRLREAEYYFVQAQKMNPSDDRIYFNLARIYAKQQKWDKAITQYEQQLLIAPEDPWSLSNIANCYLQKGELDQAKAYLLKTVAADPEGDAGRSAHFILSSLHAVEVSS